MKKKLLLIVSTIVLASSCIDHEDLYDPSKVKADAKANFPLENIDPTQNWATRGTRTLDVTVNEKAGQTYTIKVFTANPLAANTDAHLLAQAEVKDGAKTSLAFDASLDLEYVYVMCKAGDKDYSVSAAPLTDNKFVASFGKSATTRAGYQLPGGIVVDEVFKKAPTNFIPLKDAVIGEQFVGGKANYYLPAGESLTIRTAPITENSHIYVSGTLTVSRALELNGLNGSVSVLEGGKLIYTNPNVTNLAIRNGAVFYNAGTVEGVSTSITTNGRWLNEGIYVGQAFYVETENSIAQNNCKMDVTELKSLDLGTFNNGGYVKCRSLVLSGDGKLNLSGKSVLDVQGVADLGVGTITGPTAKPYPLFRANTLNQYQSQAVTVNNTVYTTEGVNNFFASKFKVVKATIGAIPDGECVPEVNIEGDETENLPVSGCTIGFEDISAKTVTDYDFNDVVLWVSNSVKENDGVDYSYIYLVAVGATNSIKVGYALGDRTYYLFEGKEVHERLGVPAGTMFNTSGTVATENLPMEKLQVAAPVLEKLNFFIEVNGKTDNLIYSKNDKEYIGGVPFGLCVNESWSFPIERTKISDAYKGFGEWGANKKTNLTWYKNGEAGLVCPFDSKLLKK